jgi:hypothetical protein
MDLKNRPDARRVFVAFPHRALLSLSFSRVSLARSSAFRRFPSPSQHIRSNSSTPTPPPHHHKKLWCQSPFLQRVSKCKQIRIRISNDQELEKTKN